MPEPTPQKTHNSLLKTTREAKGLTLDIVHEATKIPLDALKAIEEGYSVRMLTPFYYRGFLKIYAEFLGLDPVEVLSRYEVQKPKPVAAPSSRFDGSTGSPLGQSKREIFSPKNRSMMVRAAGIVLAVVVVLKVGGCAVYNTLYAFKKHPAIRSAAAVKKIQRAEEPAASRSQIIKIQNGAKVSLAVRVPRNTWIRVKTDDKIVFEGRMKKGTMENWSAREQIEISGKNINELDLEVNGRHIGPLGGTERGAKRVVITKEGLTVKK
jgi:cytoskeletal protein RodZ